MYEKGTHHSHPEGWERLTPLSRKKLAEICPETPLTRDQALPIAVMYSGGPQQWTLY